MMSNKIEPNSNHFNKDSITDGEKEIEEDIPGFKDDIEISTDSTDYEPPTSKSTISKEQYRSKLIKILIIIIVLFTIIMIVGFFISKASKKNYSYADVEEVMEDAARNYFKDNKKKLPTSSDQDVSISDRVLEQEGYMKSMDKYLTDQCSGDVVVSKVDQSTYNYTTYLDCGNKYKTKELYQAIIEQEDVVSSGYGLYQMNNEYVYRGLDVNNYVKFNHSDILWRIVKVTSDNDIVLIHNDTSINFYPWDNRYNSATDDNSGINVFQNSHMSTVLPILYKGYFGNEDNDDLDDYSDFYEEVAVLTKKDRKRVKIFNSCVGSRAEEDTSKDGSSECSVTYQTKMSLLPAYDYINASIDPGCNTVISPECQNYNYLSIDHTFWLMTGDSDYSEKIYRVSSNGDVVSQYASVDTKVRVVIHLGSDAMILKGKGSKKDPYIIR